MWLATGKIGVPMQTQRPQDSIFEEQVLDALTRRGYVVHAKVGCADSFLDLGVVDSKRPGAMCWVLSVMAPRTTMPVLRAIGIV
jgi:hypothetical protein